MEFDNQFCLMFDLVVIILKSKMFSYPINNFCFSEPIFMKLEYNVYNYSLNEKLDNQHCLTFDLILYDLENSKKNCLINFVPFNEGFIKLNCNFSKQNRKFEFGNCHCILFKLCCCDLERTWQGLTYYHVAYSCSYY